MMIVILILFAAVFLAYTNGANDNFKGVATLFGSGTTNYKKALWWATITTFAGSLTAVFIAQKLIVSFSGKGLVPDMIVHNPQFLAAVGIGAALTILGATVTGIPISTTHALTGTLVGTGLIAAGNQINLSILGNKFFIPLLLSPLIATLLTFIMYSCFRFMRVKLGVERQMCLCIGGTNEAVRTQPDGIVVLQSSGAVLTIDQLKNCQQFYRGEIMGFDSQNIVDKLHYISSGAVGFARGLNDAPKIVAVLFGFVLGGAFGAAKESIKAHLNRSGEEVLDTVYQGDEKKKNAVVSKSWRYLKRAHIHGSAIGTAALGAIVVLSLLGSAGIIEKSSAMALGAGALLYSLFWFFAGMKAPALGSTLAAKESLKFMAIPGAGLCILGLCGTLVSIIKQLYTKSPNA